MDYKDSDQPSLYVVGIGPGSSDLLPSMAIAALNRSKTIVGYSRYIELLPPNLTRGKNILSLGMRKEKDRCCLAIESALNGSPTSIISSGDAGIYAMAGLIIELLEQKDLISKLNLAIIPGIPALCAAAALLGAPLMHDFAVISLSDLLTPWSKIKDRLAKAAQADFVLVIYNPKSKGRPDYLKEALKIISQFREPSCPVGIVRNAYRSNQWRKIATINDFDPNLADMLSLIIVGNSETRQVSQYMLTPRGYRLD
ncbi:MAG: precorrin-3B C(17)-methyltransferase [Desulfovibrionaceae bacterium]|nr:precorrin-3B C(17)-methyltransferase [Desulfovibrionaceae bacterium]